MPWGAQTWMAIVPEPSYGVYAGSLAGAFYPRMIGGNAFNMRKVPIRQIIRSADGGNRRAFVVGSRRAYQGTLTTPFNPYEATNLWAKALMSNGTSLATAQATYTTGPLAITGITFPYSGTMGSGYTPSSAAIPVSFVGGGGIPPAHATCTSNSSGQILTGTAIGNFNAGGGTTAYSSIPGVIIGGMPSYTLVLWDGVRVWEFLGAMVQSATITSTATQDYAMISVNWVAQTLGTDFVAAGFPQPAGSAYSSLNPYLHIETAGNVTLTTENTGGTPIVIPIDNYRQMSFTLTNIIQPTWDEQSYATSLLYCGRDMNFSIGPQYIGQQWPITHATTGAYDTFRGMYESQEPISLTVKWNRPSVNSFTINAQTNSYVSNIQDDIPLDNASYQNISIEAFIDASTAGAGNDFTLAGT